MVLVVADARNIRPGGRAVALEALLDFRVWFAGDLRGHHVEVHHVVTGRRLVALRAVSGLRGGMTKRRNRPHLRAMALRAVTSHESEVGVFVAVARGAVEKCFTTGQAGLEPQGSRRARVGFHVRFESAPRLCVAFLERSEAQAREDVVVHHGQVRRYALMLDVA